VSDVSYKDMTWEQVLALEDEHSPTIGVPTGLLDLRGPLDQEGFASLKRALLGVSGFRFKIDSTKVMPKKPFARRKAKALRGRRDRRVGRRVPKP
jgi:hypothetical protein